MNGILDELRHAWRVLVRRPVFTLIAVLSIALGVGANAGMFSVVNALLLRPVAGVGAPEGAVEIGRTEGGGGFDTFSYHELQQLQALGGPLEEVAGYRIASMSLSTTGEGERIVAYAVSPEYFAALGTSPALGRFFSAEEGSVPGTAPVAVVSHAFWQERLGGAREAVGRQLTLNRQVFTIVGVAAEEFLGHLPVVRPDLYIPLTMMAVAQPGFNEFGQRRASWLLALGRLAPGATVAQADAAVRALFTRLGEQDPGMYERRSARVLPLGAVPGGGRGPTTMFLTMLMVLVGLILLVTCANVAGMLLARGAGREREIAIRLALGAGRMRLIRQLVVEAVVLFLIGGVAGLVLATRGVAALSAIRLPAPVPLHFDFTADARVLAFGLTVALLTGLIFGLAPALQSTRLSLVSSLKSESSRGGSAGGRLRRLFVAGQVGVTVLLLLSAGLFMRALQRAAAVDTGFSATGVAVASINLAMDGYDDERGQQFLAELTQRLGTAPGVTAAGVTSDLPLDLSISESPAYIEGRATDAEQGGMSSAFARTDAGYFRATGVRLLRGRVFDARDTRSSDPVVVVSRIFAERAWPGEDPIGKRVRWPLREGTPRRVIGVVADVKNQMLMEDTGPMIYLPVTQLYRPELSVVVRSSAGAAAAAASLRRTLRELDPRLSLTPPQSLASYNALGTLPQRIAAFSATAFGAIALLLSAIGIYGVIAFMVAQRTREIGVRMALGSDRRAVVRLVIGHGMRLALPGAAIGAVAGLGVAFLLRSFILGVAPTDPVALLGAPAVLLAAVLIACWMPAARAASVQPMEALRAE